MSQCRTFTKNSHDLSLEGDTDAELQICESDNSGAATRMAKYAALVGAVAL